MIVRMSKVVNFTSGSEKTSTLMDGRIAKGRGVKIWTRLKNSLATKRGSFSAERVENRKWLSFRKEMKLRDIGNDCGNIRDLIDDRDLMLEFLQSKHPEVWREIKKLRNGE